MVACKYIPISLLNDVGMHDSFTQLLTNYGLKKFISMHEHTFVDLNMEFYTTLEVNANDSHILEFRMLGKLHQLTYSFRHVLRRMVYVICQSLLMLMNFGVS